MTSIDWQEPDGLLQALVSLVNEGKINFNVMLNVKGTILTGKVVTRHQYIEVVGELFASSMKEGTDDLDDTAADVLEDITRKLYPQLSGGVDQQDAIFIHLENVEYLAPKNISFGDAAFPVWRFRLSAIDGWIIQ